MPNDDFWDVVIGPANIQPAPQQRPVDEVRRRALEASGANLSEAERGVPARDLSQRDAATVGPNSPRSLEEALFQQEFAKRVMLGERQRQQNTVEAIQANKATERNQSLGRLENLLRDQDAIRPLNTQSDQAPLKDADELERQLLLRKLISR